MIGFSKLSISTIVTGLKVGSGASIEILDGTIFWEMVGLGVLGSRGLSDRCIKEEGTLLAIMGNSTGDILSF